MRVDFVETPPQEIEADVIAFAVADPPELPPAARTLDGVVGGRLAHLIEDGEVSGESGEVTFLHTLGDLPAHRVAAAGLGKREEVDADALRTAAAKVAVRAGGVRASTVAWILDAPDSGLDAVEQARAVVDGAALGPHDAGRWKTNGRARPELERLILCGTADPAVAEEARRAAVVSAWTNRCRDLVNAPPNELTPQELAAFARELAERFGTLSCETLGPEEIRAAGMGALAAVSQGSDTSACLITLRYEPEGATPAGDFLLGLVGKAITFDSGGLSLKPADRMDDMKADMSGGGAVLAAMGAIAELGVPLPIVAVVAAAENMPGGHAYRPSDIVRALNGKTIEVTNTDAEGRLILADALWHARGLGATHLLDVATLTGGIVTAMGDYYAGLFGNDDGWIERIRSAAEASGDHVWPMPLHPTYSRYLRSAFADLKNSSDLREASPILGARFLQQFVGEGPWAHLDIAGTAFLERSRNDYYCCTGGTGFGVRLIAELARRLAERGAGVAGSS